MHVTRFPPFGKGSYDPQKAAISQHKTQTDIYPGRKIIRINNTRGAASPDMRAHGKRAHQRRYKAQPTPYNSSDGQSPPELSHISMECSNKPSYHTPILIYTTIFFTHTGKIHNFAPQTTPKPLKPCHKQTPPQRAKRPLSA